MKYRVIAVVTAVFTLLFCAGVTLVSSDHVQKYERYQQHESMQQLADLPEADREAASSLNIDPNTFASHLPVISIDTRGQEIPGRYLIGEDGKIAHDETDARLVELSADGRETIPVSFKLFVPDEDNPAAVRLSDEPELTAQAELRYRGHSSRTFDKPSYQVKFTQEDRVTSEDHDLLGMGEGSSWAMNGPFLDKTLLRNYVAMSAFGEVMSAAPDVRLVEVFVNDTYQGVYVLMETVRRGENRVDIKKSDPKSAATSFIVKRDWYSGDSETLRDFLYKDRVATQPMVIVYPSEATITDAQREWIRRELNQFEKSLYSYDYDTGNYGYWNYIDVDSFIDYFLVNELSLNVDSGKLSTYFYRDLGGKLTIGPLWDYNNSFNDYIENDLSNYNGFALMRSPLFFMLLKDERFVERTIDRYKELRKGALSDETLISTIDSAAAYLEPARNRNYLVWGYSFDPELVTANEKLSPDERNPKNYDEALAQLKGTLLERTAWLDVNIEHLRQYCHESAVKRYNH